MLWKRCPARFQRKIIGPQRKSIVSKSFSRQLRLPGFCGIISLAECRDGARRFCLSNAKCCNCNAKKLNQSSYFNFQPLPGQRCILVAFWFRKGHALSRLLSNGNSLTSGHRPEKTPFGTWGVRESPERLLGIGCERKIFSLLKIESTKSKVGFQITIL